MAETNKLTEENLPKPWEPLESKPTNNLISLTLREKDQFPNIMAA